MDYRVLIAGLLLILYAAITHATTISGACNATSVQCDLEMREMRVCNDSQDTENYNTYFSSATGNWFNVIPDKFTLGAGECTEVKVYTVAGCYANPGRYSAQLVVQGSTAAYATCTLDLEQGHSISIAVEPGKQESTQCGQKDYTIKVANNSRVKSQGTERVDISITGLPEGWYTLDKTQVIVGKDDTETAELRVVAPCDAGFAKYQFKVRGSLPDPEFYSESTAEFSVKQGQAAKMTAVEGFTEGTAEACVETGGEAKIRVANKGRLADNYKLMLKGAPFAELEKTQLSLEPGASENISIKFLQTAEKAGTYTTSIKLESTRYNYSATEEFPVNLVECYGVKVLKTSGDEKACSEDRPEYKFSIRNTEAKPVEIAAGLGGIGGELSASKMRIAPGEEKELVVSIDANGLAKAAKASKEATAVVLLADTSGSMAERVDGERKIEAAKTAITNLVNSINRIDFGLRVFGQGAECEDSKQLIQVKKLDAAEVTGTVSGFTPSGKTPLAQAITAAAGDFPAGRKKAMIVVSDGKETCGGSIPEAAAELHSRGISAYTIGFDIDKKGKEELEELASRTGARYYDAHNSAGLASVLKQVARELDIVPGEQGMKTFTLTLDSAHFSYEKDFSIRVSDCYGAAIEAPELDLCPGVAKKDYFTIANTGTRDQSFRVAYFPEWISGPSEVRVKSGETAKMELTAIQPRGSTVKRLSISADSDRASITQENNINTLSAASCYAVDIIIMKPELDAAACTGVKQSLIIENRGVTEQEVSVTVDKNYAYLAEEKAKIGSGERRTMHYFVSPPLDLPETSFITFTAVTNNGFETRTMQKLYLHENEVQANTEQLPGEADIRIADLNAAKSGDLNYDFSVEFLVYNDSNSTLQILNAKVLDYNGTISMENQLVMPRESTQARLLVDLPAGLDAETYAIPVSFETDEGTYTRDIVFFNPSDANAANGTAAHARGNASIGTGLLTITNLSTVVLGVLILIVIALIARSSYMAGKLETKDDLYRAPEKGQYGPAHKRTEVKRGKKPKSGITM